MSFPTPLKVILDTDIGSDVDDLLALAVLLGSPEWDLTTVSTVYGDTVLRARIVRRAYRLAYRPDRTHRLSSTDYSIARPSGRPACRSRPCP
jgi:inosine-uridine nucleoside N-ribohydrolase